MADQDEERRGHGMLLGGFIFTLAILAPLFAIGATIGYVPDILTIAAAAARIEGMAAAMLLATYAARIALLWYAAWSLWRRRVRRSLTVAIAAVWASPMIGFAGFVGIAMLTRMYVPNMMVAIRPEAVGSAIFALVATLYLMMSYRVQSLYAGDHDERVDAEIFA